MSDYQFAHILCGLVVFLLVCMYMLDKKISKLTKENSRLESIIQELDDERMDYCD
jgi:hypothetical protein